MNKYQKILNLMAINSNSQYRYDSRGRGCYRIEFEGDDTILFYEGDHTKPDSKKVFDFKNGKYGAYENINWQDQTKPVKWELRNEFLILDFQHIADGLNECPVSLEHNPYINKQTKDAKETAYVVYLYRQANSSIINGFRRVWVDPKKDIKEQVIEAGKIINGYPKYWITDKQVKANVAAFNKAKTFNFKTKFVLYVTKNEPNFNFLAPKEFFVPFKKILKDLGFNYVWKEYTGENILKFDPQTNPIYNIVQVLSNWHRRGALSGKNLEFFYNVPPIAKEFPFLVTPNQKIIDAINKKAEEQSKKFTCDLKDQRLLDIISKILQPGYRYSSYSIFFAKGACFISTSTESYNKQTKKWEKGFGGFTVTPVIPNHLPAFVMPVLADLIALSKHPQAEELIQMLIDHLHNRYEEDIKKDEGVIKYLEAMISTGHHFSMYFKIKLPQYKNKVFFVNYLPEWIIAQNLSEKELDAIEMIKSDKGDWSKAILISHVNIAEYFKHNKK